MDDARQRLINMAQGGDGRQDPWIEQVTLRQEGQADRIFFVLHLPDRLHGQKDVQIAATLTAAQNILIALNHGARPGDRLRTREEMDALRAALPLPEDLGRVVNSIDDIK